MAAIQRIEQSLHEAVDRAAGRGCPPKLAAAIQHAVFPGGARVRPRLAVAVAKACGDDYPALSDATASSIELLHCASLVHDDLPCFDDADTRRGLPSVHKAYGAPLAVLAGDALIVLAFEQLAMAAAEVPSRLVALTRIIASSVGGPTGIVAGQGWESEPLAVLQDYHRAKTGSLFVAATCGGAIAAGADPAHWETLGDSLGEAYQVADDLRDLLLEAEALGKPQGQDDVHGRLNAATELGIPGAVNRLRQLVANAVSAIPDCPGAGALEQLVYMEAKRLMPEKIARHAA